MTDYSVGWSPSRRNWGHVEIGSTQGEGCVEGHLNAAIAVLRGITPADPGQGAALWELEVQEALDLLASAARHRSNQ